MGVPSIRGFSVSRKFQEEWGSSQECWKLREICGGHWVQCKEVGAGERTCQMSGSGTFSTPGKENIKGIFIVMGVFASLKPLNETFI